MRRNCITTAVPLLCLLTAAILGISCHRPYAATANTSFTDDYGRTVAVPSAPQRIVSASPAVTEILFSIGAGDLLVGRTDFCAYPPKAASVESIGGISNLNVEKIASLNPDLVISGSMVPKKTTLQLEKMGVPIVCIIEKQTFNGLYGNIEAIGRLVGRSQQADSLCHLIRQRASRIPAAAKERPSVYYVVGFGSTGNYTAGGNSFINDIILLAGGRNIAESVKGWNYSTEALIQADPDFIVIRREDSARFCSTRPYSDLSAVRSGRVAAIESGTIDLQSPRNVDAVETLAAFIRNHQ